MFDIQRFDISRFVSKMALIVGLISTGVPASADHPNQPQGFDPERSYQTTAEIDQVDLYTGRLSAHIPVGPFNLFYNSNVWRYSYDSDGKIVAQPDRATTAGLGWHLGWGELYQAGHWYNPNPNNWLYVGDDGSRHVFYQTLHYDDPNTENTVLYTRDGSYLRLTVDTGNSCWAEIEFPDGNTRRFGRSNCGPATPLRWKHSWNRFGSLSDPDLTVTYNSDDTLRTVTDRYGRQWSVHLTDQYHWVLRTITSIQGPAFDTGTATYTFHYDETLVHRSCKDDSPTTATQVAVPLLRSLDLPDGSSYDMKDGGTLRYRTACDGIADSPGALERVVLPTGGKVEWEYQEFEFPPGGTNSVFNTAVGVSTRRLLGSDDVELGSWTYKTTQTGASGGNDPEMKMEVVVLPEGDCTRHLFNAIHWVNPSTGKGWENGLPFTYTESSGGRFLSQQTWTGNTNGSCSGTKLRSQYVNYRHDTLPGTNQNIDQWYASNRQVSGTRTVFHDDGDKYIDVALGNFDGLGHFRTTTTTGTLYNADSRQVHVDYNLSSGNYPGSFTPIDSSIPWTLGVYASVETTETAAEGETKSRTEYHFDDTTGALECMRQLTSDTSQSDTDLLTTYTRNTRGLVTDVKSYGGDIDTIGMNEAVACGATVTDPVYWQHMTYEDGVLKTRRPRHSNGTDGPFLTYDVDLDPSTGLISTRRSPAGYATDYTYDTMGRVTRVTPQDGAEVHFTYDNPTGSSGGRVTTSAYAEGGGILLTQHETVLDSLGRVHLSRILMPDGTWSETESLYNARGWMTSVSQPGDKDTTTAYLDHDPFGRVGIIRPPEGTSHDIVLGYTGVRQTTQQVSIVTDLNGDEDDFTTTRTFDSFGRLRTVTEPSAAGNGSTSTSYGYDVGGRLTRITSGPASQHQFRLYDYDNRGFLLSESHPELGTVTYGDYDPRGRSHGKADGAHDLEYAYDFMGRLTTVTDTGPTPNRPVKTFTYDTAQGFGAGKIHHLTRHNYIDLPWDSSGVVDVQVKDQFNYDGIGGAVSQQDTFVTWPDASEQFRALLTYDDLGNVASRTYPWLVAPTVTGSAAAGQTVSYTHSRGLLTGITGWVDAIDYHPSGLWKTIEHSNGVDHHQDHDTNRHLRPGQIYAKDAQSVTRMDTGLYSYDGAGNIAAMGTDAFRYDGVSRLVEASVSAGALGQDYTYDRFGNMTQRTTTITGSAPQTETFGIDSLTNRLTGATYDGAGNVTAYGADQFGYNTSNRLVSQAWMRYLYNGFDERVLSVRNAPQRTVHYHLRGPGHQRLSHITYSNGTFQRERDWVYGRGRLLASGTPNGDRYHYYADHLGTPRLITDGAGYTRAEPFLFPFGEEFPYDSGIDNVRFTGHERDASTGTDYMHARHYFSSIARFLSVDPARGYAGVPQSLNRYAYVLGNPLRYTDPDGRHAHEEGFGEEIDVTAPDPGMTVDVSTPRPPGNVSPFPGANGGGRVGGSGGGSRGGQEPNNGTDDEPVNLDDIDPEGWLDDADDLLEDDDEEEDDPLIGLGCNATIKPVGTVGGGIGALVGVGGSGTLTVDGHASGTVYGGLGAGAGFTVGGGVSFGQGNAVGPGWGGEIQITPTWFGPSILIGLNFTDNGAWSGTIGVGPGASTIAEGVIGRSYTVANECRK